MQFIKKYWFGLITGTMIFIFLGMFILVLLSPRQDVQKRGFIPCTDAMAAQLSGCRDNGGIGCMLGGIVQNSWCEMKVIGKGIKLWISGQQTAPWSNYIFIPEVVSADEDFDEEARQEHLRNNPPFSEEMQELKILNEELENEQQEISADEQPQ